MRFDTELQTKLSQLFEAGDLDAVDYLLSSVNNSNSNDPTVDHARAQLCVRQGNLAKACEYFESLCQSFPDYPQFSVELANTHVSLGDSQLAQSLLRDTISRSPSYAPARLALSTLLIDASCPDQAASLLREFLRLEPDHVRANQKLGLCLKHLGKLPEAEAQFQRVLKLDSNEANALFQLGLLAYERRCHKQCIEHLSRCTKIAPHHTEALIILARSHQSLGQIEPALQHYRAAVKVDRSLYYRVAKNLVSGAHGVFWLRTSDLREALGLENDRS